MLELSSCHTFLLERGAISSWDTHWDGGARRVGSIARRGQRCQWPPPALGSVKSEQASYVRPLALVGILWNSLHNQMQHNRNMHVCLGFNSNYTYKSTPGIQCGLLVKIYMYKETTCQHEPGDWFHDSKGGKREKQSSDVSILHKGSCDHPPLPGTQLRKLIVTLATFHLSRCTEIQPD